MQKGKRSSERVKVYFPYPDIKPLILPPDCQARFFRPAEWSGGDRYPKTAQAALENPIQSSRLRDLAKGKSRVLIVSDDNTRPTSVKELLPALLRELSEGGILRRNIELIMALGSHRPMSPEEMSAKLGEDVVRDYRVHNHLWSDARNLKYLGTNEQGVPIWVNRILRQFDLVVGVGSIMPIDICGFSGGGKILVPGLCGEQTVDRMHWDRVNIPTEKILGQAENPIRCSIDELARRAGLSFIVNVVLNARDEVVGVFAGDMIAAHRAGCALAREVYGVRFDRDFDIVIADSHPFDIEFWQANKALDTAGEVVAKGGVVILVTPCYEGLSRTHGEQIRKIGYPPIETIKRLVEQGQIPNKVVAVHMFQVSRVAVEKAKLILVSGGLDRTDVERFGFRWAPDPDSALAMAMRLVGKQPHIAVLQGAARMLARRN